MSTVLINAIFRQPLALNDSGKWASIIDRANSAKRILIVKCSAVNRLKMISKFIY